jgi:hypothetical protein
LGTDPSSPVVTPSRAAARRSRTRRLVVPLIALVLAIGVGGAGALWLRGGGAIVPTVVGGERRETPTLTFEVRKVEAQPISRTDPQRLGGEAEAAADRVRQTLEALYQRGFVDPETWGRFDAIAELFDPLAREQAELDLDVLTLGATAETTGFVEPRSGRLAIVVLTDAKDRAIQAIAGVRFRALAEASDGTTVRLASSGSFFLHRVDDAWRIIAYRIDRDDRPGATTSPAEASP